MSPQLPSSTRNLDVPALSRLFADVTTSYKHLFFQGLIDLLVASRFQKSILRLDDVVVEMLRIGWYPHAFFRLSFGLQDRVSSILDALNVPREEGKYVERLRARIKEIEPAGFRWKLLRYVPYRLLSPFLEEELKGVPDTKKDALIQRLVHDGFDDVRPLYRFHDQGTIELHPDWLDYLKTNISIVQGWMHWERLRYLQQRNPSVPAISSKLASPPERLSMPKERAFWRTVLDHKPLHCIYTGELLDPSRFALDHFLPWSFVAHNQLWNLVPVAPEANSAKGDRIPSDKYLGQLIRIQHQGLVTVHSVVSKRTWTKLIEAYISDLRIGDVEDLLDLDMLSQGYKATVPPLMRLAESIGFSSGWSGREAAETDQRHGTGD
jgi:hypothetical protein